MPGDRVPKATALAPRMASAAIATSIRLARMRSAQAPATGVASMPARPPADITMPIMVWSMRWVCR